MIRCLPLGICSWNFHLSGNGHDAYLSFHWMSEQGSIRIDRKQYEVYKHGPFSGRWTLEQDGMKVATAQKLNLFTRTFEIQEKADRLTLRAQSPFTRRFLLERSEKVIATIEPDHMFTRRATINTPADKSSVETMAFAFWLVVVTWRRAARNNSSGGGGGA